MTEPNDLSGKVGLDTSDFKAGITSLNKDLRVLDSEFKASAAALGDWKNDANGLELRLTTLTKSIDLQQQKVALLKKAYEDTAAAKGADSNATKEAEIKYNKSVETLNKMNVELNDTKSGLDDLKNGSNDAGNKVQDLGKKTDDTGKKLISFKDILSGVGTIIKGAITLVVGLAVAVGAVSGAITGLVLNAASAADELDVLSQQTGISTTRLQELKYAGDQIGVSQDTIAGSLAKLTRNIGAAAGQYDDYNKKQSDAQAKGQAFDGQLGSQAEAFQKLGVPVRDANGSLRDSEVVFQDALIALKNIQDPTERDVLAMDLFGKSAQELNPLINAGAGELAHLSDEAHKMGAVVSGENVQALASLNDMLDGLKDGLTGTLATLAAAFVPGFKSLFGQAGGYLQEFAGIIQNSNGDFGQMATGIGGLVQKIITDIAGQAPQLMQAGLGILKSIINALIAALPVMLPAGMEIIKSLISFIVQNLPTLTNAAVQILLMLVSMLIQNLPMLINAALQAIITLANGLTAALPTLIPAIVLAVLTIVQTLINNLPMLIDAALKLILALANGLVAALPILIPVIPVIIKTLFDAIIKELPLIAEAAGELVATLVAGIISALPGVISAAFQIIQTVYNTIGPQATAKLLWSIGKGFVEGIWQGIQNARSWFFNQITNFFGGLVDTVRNAIGWHSPAAVFVPGGESIPQGLGVGIKKAMPSLHQQLNQAMNGLVHDYNFGVNANLRGGVNGGLGGMQLATAGASISVGDIYVDARGTTNPKAVGQAVGDSVLKRIRSLGGA